jgi:hypothetical protein
MKKGKNKGIQKAGKKETSIVRSSAAEYLTFVAATGQGGVEAVYSDENIWLTQKMMGVLYDVETHTINYHLKKVFSDSELEEDSVIQNFRITAADGKNYNTKHYNLSAIIAVGYKVNSERAVQFRKWATQIIQEFTIKGYTIVSVAPCPFAIFRSFGMKNEKMKSAMERKTFQLNNSSHRPPAQTSLIVPMKNVKINVPTMIPRPVPAT